MPSLLCCLLFAALLAAATPLPLPEVGLTLEQLIAHYGYPSETHRVVTGDGYVLALTRIPRGGRPAVLLMPGLLCDAGWYVINGRNASLGFWLADRGYDVWIGNYRGTTHSRAHVALDPDADAAFWDYSFDEMGLYDIPAFIDHILDTTGLADLSFVGHSQGTAAFFAMASQLPEYNRRVRLMAALAPIAFLSHTTHAVVRFLADNPDLLQLAAAAADVHETLPHSDFLTEVGSALCNDDAPTQVLCVAVLEVMGGWDLKELNKTMIPVFTSHTPAGGSVKQLVHFLQEVVSGRFRRYDYGTVGNMLRYGAPDPPDYPIANITAPVALLYGRNDLYANVKDIDLLAERLPNLVYRYVVEDEEFSHLDFGLAVHSEELYFEELLRILNEH